MILAYALFLALSAPVVAAPVVAAQAQGRIAPPAGRTADSWISHYVEGKRQETATLFAAGLGADWTVVRRQVERYLPPQSYPGNQAGGQAVLRAAHVRSTANFLVSGGYRARHMKHPAQARRLARAAARMGSSDSDLATVAATVVIADLFLANDAADGSSALIYRVVEPIKNAPAKGAMIRLTLRAATPPSPFPPPPQPGEGELRLPGRVALFLSPPRAIGGLRGTGDAYVSITAPMRLNSSKLTPGYHSDIPEITLTRLRAVVREQVCAPGFVAVGAAGTSLRC